MTYGLKWETEVPVLNEQETKHLAAEIARVNEDLESPEDLIFHTVWLDDSMDGPCVIVVGKPGDRDNFYLSYYNETNWVTLEE